MQSSPWCKCSLRQEKAHRILLTRAYDCWLSVSDAVRWWKGLQQVRHHWMERKGKWTMNKKACQCPTSKTSRHRLQRKLPKREPRKPPSAVDRSAICALDATRVDVVWRQQQQLGSPHLVARWRSFTLPCLALYGFQWSASMMSLVGIREGGDQSICDCMRLHTAPCTQGVFFRAILPKHLYRHAL